MQLFHPQLLGQPFGDPALYIEMKGEKNALLFDIGDISLLRPGKLLKLSHVFVSHTHMDHFIGFDHLLRLFLSRNTTLHIYGPRGIINNIRGKLQGYTWNLVDSYPFILEVSEMLVHSMRTAIFPCKNGFKHGPITFQAFDGIAHKAPNYTVQVLSLDHKIPSLAYAVQERFHININKDRLIKCGLPVGPWLRELKEYLWEGKPDNIKVKIYEKNNSKKIIARVALGELKQTVCTLSRGQKIVYISDCRGSEENFRKIISFAKSADIMFCEGTFLAKDRSKAEERGHLTAEQAGVIARQAGVKKLQIYHFSPRYEHCPETLYKEAERAFQGRRVTGEPRSEIIHEPQA